jgi:alpha-methylacyl-CoA racemase
MKSARGVDFIKSLVSSADILLDPYRPGVLEKLGLGPDVLLKINPKLIVGRMTGFRRDGRYKDMAGHDINYIAVSGALSLFGRKGEKPLAPGNILGDFAGGGATLFQGLLLALIERGKTGKGQVVEANMVDGSAYLTTFPRMQRTSPSWDQPRGENLLDGGNPFYDTYETRDGKYMAVGALEPQFFAALLKGLGLAGKGIEESRSDRDTWPELKTTFTKTFKTKTRAEWERIFDGTDACCTPVLDFDELASDPNREGDERPAVTLRGSPSLSAPKGQGSGTEEHVDGAEGLYPGEGGENTLEQWLGWRRGQHFEVAKGGLVTIPKPSSRL